MVFIRKKIFSYFLNAIKIRDIIIFRVNNKKEVINFEDINYDILELRDIKIAVIKYLLNKIDLNKSFKDHLFNYLYMRDPNIHRKACLIKFLLDKKFKIEEISAPFLLKKDLALFKKFNLKIKKIKPHKIKFKPNLSLISMILLLKHRKIQLHKLTKHFSDERSRYNPKIKYFTMFRAKIENSEKIYLNKLYKSLDNTIIYINPYLSPFTFRLENYIKHLKNNARNYFFHFPKIEYYDGLKKAIKIFLSSFLNELKIPLYEIILQRIEIDNIVKNINEYFPDIQEFYANISSNPSTTYLTEKLKESKIKVIIFANGLGVNCPLTNYDVFYVFSKMQRQYYLGSSKFKYYKSNDCFKIKRRNSKKKIALFLICQNLFSYKILKYTDIYQEVIDYIEQIVKDYDFPVYAKYHPGSTEKDKILSDKIIIIKKIEDLPSEYKYLAVTLYSSYAIELLDIMPFLIINPQKKINMEYYFPNNDSFYVKNYQGFKERIDQFQNDDKSYYEYWENLCQFFN